MTISGLFQPIASPGKPGRGAFVSDSKSASSDFWRRKEGFVSRVILNALLLASAVLVIGAASARAYPRYNDGCQNCHGAFNDGTSPIGTVFPSDDKHVMHRSNQEMNTDCNLCHTSGDGNNPFIGSSDGTATNVGVGCVGCHGREEDNVMGNPEVVAGRSGRGAGLRQHHDNSGVGICLACHLDASTASYLPVDEDVFPQYYGTVDTNADMPCNDAAVPQMDENWSVGDLRGLDNDGDLLYDLFDVIPCPEPSGSMLMSSGMTFLLLLGRRRTARRNPVRIRT